MTDHQATTPVAIETELQEIELLTKEIATMQFRLECAAERLEETGDNVRRIKKLRFDGRGDPDVGSRVHLLREKSNGDVKWDRDRAHRAEACNRFWCHEDGEPRFADGGEFSFAYRGAWRVLAYLGDEAIIVREVAR